MGQVKPEPEPEPEPNESETPGGGEQVTDLPNFFLSRA